MNIIDRARDALNKATPGPWGHYTPDYGKPNPVFGATPGDDVATVKRREDHALIAAAPELAAALVRLADLADELTREAVTVGVSGTIATDETKVASAARIRQAIEGAES